MSPQIVKVVKYTCWHDTFLRQVTFWAILHAIISICVYAWKKAGRKADRNYKKQIFLVLIHEATPSGQIWLNLAIVFVFSTYLGNLRGFGVARPCCQVVLNKNNNNNNNNNCLTWWWWRMIWLFTKTKMYNWERWRVKWVSRFKVPAKANQPNGNWWRLIPRHCVET